MKADLRDTSEYAAIEEHLRRVQEPAFGRPSSLRELHATSDGVQVAFTGLVFDELVGLPRSAVYSVQDGALQQISTSSGSSRWPRFSPDGSVLALLSDRAEAGVFQLHLLHVGHLGEADATAAVPGTVEYAHWSPDGSRLLLGVAGFGADLSGGQGSGTNQKDDSGGTPNWQPEVEYDVDESGWRSLWLYTVKTDEVIQLSPAGMNCWEGGWSGPEKVVSVASDSPSENSWYDATLRVIDVRDRSVREVYRSATAQLGLPTGSPDGKHASVVQAICSDRWVVAGDLILVDLMTDAATAADTRGTDVTGLQWLDTTRLGYFGQRHLDSVASVLDVATGLVDELVSTDRFCGGSTFYPDGVFTGVGTVLTIQDSYDLPQQIVVTGHGAGEGTDVILASIAHPGTDYLMSVGGSAEPISWTAPDGLEIEGVLCTPEGDGPFPLVVNIHGGPIWAYRNSWSVNYPWVPLLVSRGYAVLNPNPRGSGGRGQEFARHVVGDMGGADTHDYLSGIDHLVDSGTVDPERVGLIGGSYGGFMSSWLVTQDQRFAAAVPISPVTDWYSQSFTSNIAGWGNAFLDADPEQPGTKAHSRSPVLQASKVRTPCLNIAGALDRCTPPGQAREFHQALRTHGVESALVIYPGEGHGIRSYPAVIDFLTRAIGWFEAHMPADRRPHSDRRNER